jgi:hypothetical protein
MTTQFSGNLMRATAMEVAAIAGLEQRLADSEEAQAQAEMVSQDAQAEALALRAERDELSRMCGELLVKERIAREVAAGLLHARQLEVAAVRELLEHLQVSTPRHDRLQRRLIANTYAAMGCADVEVRTVQATG